MLIEPADLPCELIAEQVVAGWGLAVDQIEYAPVGFGSHHWWLYGPGGERWFATVDDLRQGDRSRETLVSALSTAAALHDGGLDFVVAPLPQPAGVLTCWIPPHYVLAVYPHFEGEAASYGNYESDDQRRQVIDRLASIHQSTSLVRDIAPEDDLSIPKRADLEIVMTAISSSSEEPWNSGPFADPAQALLAEHLAPLQTALARYDRVSRTLAATRERWVVTHGEPHRGNTIVNDDGVQLIDWETARIAAPERDLWALIDEDARSQSYYSDRTGIELDPAALELYRSWWSLCEVSLYTADLSAPHERTAETQIAWEGLREHVPQAIARETH